MTKKNEMKSTIERETPGQLVQQFLDNAKPECFSCGNFGGNSCPAFNMAVKNGADEKTLTAAITEIQKGKDLRPCDKA